MSFDSDLIDQVLAKRAGRQAQDSKVKKVSLKEAIWSDAPTPDGEFNSYRMKRMVEDKICKDLKTTDISSLRLISLADKVGTLENDKVVFLKMLEANGTQRVTDFQVRLRERRIGQQTAQFLNLNVDAFAPEAQGYYPARTNTTGFLGNQLNIRIIGAELAAQSPVQPNFDVIQSEVEFEMVRIRRAMEQYMLWNQEVTAEVASVPPQWGGFINRSTTYTNPLAANTDFTNGLIQTAVDSIANITNPEGVGYIDLICICPFAQLAKVRDLMISRYPGTQYDSYSTEQTALGQKMKEAGLYPEAFQYYKPMPGGVVLFISSPLLSTAAANTAIFFDPSQPMLGKMQLMGTYGPWVIERPTAALTNLLYCFDGATLLDSLQPTRYVQVNINQ